MGRIFSRSRGVYLFALPGVVVLFCDNMRARCDRRRRRHRPRVLSIFLAPEPVAPSLSTHCNVSASEKRFDVGGRLGERRDSSLVEKGKCFSLSRSLVGCKF